MTFAPRYLLLVSAIHGVAFAAIEAPPRLPAGGKPLLVAGSGEARIIGAPEVSATPANWEEVPGGKGVAIVTRKAFPNPWNAQVWFPFQGVIESSDACLLWFYARSPAGTAEGTVQVESREPGAYAKALAHDFQVGKDWTLVLVPFPAMQAVAAGQGSISLHLGRAAQQIDIAGLALHTFGNKVALTELPRPALSYPGRETDAKWRKEALERIEAKRKGDFVITVVDAAGKPVTGATVSVDLRRHEFGFGSAVTADWLNRPGKDGAMYREIVDSYFSRVVLENDLKEKGWRLGKQTPPDGQFRQEWTMQALDWLARRNIETRGHCLTWGVFDPTNEHLKGDPAALKARLVEHMDEVVPAIGHRVVEWDVINHPASWSPTNRIDTVLGPSLYPDLMRRARRLSTVPMWLNEDQVFRPGRQQEAFHDAAKSLVDAGLAPDGLGLQGHFHCSFLPAPEEMLRVSDRFAKLVPRLQITEFDILANGDERLQADWFRDCLIMAFSHEAYTGFQTWGFWERTVVRKEAMPWKADWSERPLAKVWKTWIGDYWDTRASGSSDAAGKFTFRGYRGRYSVIVGTPDGQKHAEFVLGRGCGTAEVRLSP